MTGPGSRAMTVGYRPCFTVDISFAWLGVRVSTDDRESVRFGRKTNQDLAC